MRLNHAFCGFAALALAGNASAQMELNEIFASHTGTDDMEFIELTGAAGASLDNIMVLVVEGQDPNFGTLDRAWDLTGLVVPGDGYFLLGDTAVPGIDFDLGASNTIENGTETFYLIDATSPATITALLGTDVSTGVDTTVLPTMGTILDIVAMVNTDYPATDRIYDGALPYGPDGTFFPAGIYRGDDRDWCTNWLDFNLGADRTPGSMNIPCDDGGLGDSVCQANDNSCFAPALMSATATSSGGEVDISANDLIVSATPVPDQPGIFFYGPNSIRVPFGNGFLCVGGGLTRLLPPVMPDAPCGTSTQPVDISGFIPGTVYFQYWYRDPGGGGAFFNTSDALALTFF